MIFFNSKRNTGTKLLLNVALQKNLVKITKQANNIARLVTITFDKGSDIPQKKSYLFKTKCSTVSFILHKNV